MSNQQTYVVLILGKPEIANFSNTVNKNYLPFQKIKVCDYIRQKKKKRKRIRGNYLTLTGKEKN